MAQAHIERVLDYIESHLKDELDISVLADIAGYSRYHFLRMFRKYVHLTPASYIRKRRISEIVRRIGDSGRTISDIAFEYGFNSKENFTRAFKKEHKILPTEFKTANCSLRLFPPFRFDADVLYPDVSLTYIDGFTLVAYPCDEESPPDFWNKYNAKKWSARLSGGAVVEDIGAMMWNSDKNVIDYYVGIHEEDAKGDLTGTVTLKIREGLYAVFDTPPSSQHDFVGVIRDTWQWIYEVWMPESGYRRANGFELESYVETSKKYSERIYIPLEAEKTDLPKGELHE